MSKSNQVPHNLTNRQKECLSLVNQGYSSKEIAHLLAIAPTTVDSHIAAAMTVLGASTRGQAARLMLRKKASKNYTSKSDHIAEFGDLTHNQTASKDSYLSQADWSRLLTLLSFRGTNKDFGIWSKIIFIVQISLLSSLALAASVLTLTGVIAILN
jgi:DNA-binding CsgD family transcriptional regulator